MGALCWAGMWFGFVARRQSGAILLTVGLVKAVPFLINMLAMFSLSMFHSTRSLGIFPVHLVLVNLLILAFYVRVIREAKYRLLREVSHGGLTRLSLSHSLVSASRLSR